jgi:hypothetical protein
MTWLATELQDRFKQVFQKKASDIEKEFGLKGVKIEVPFATLTNRNNIIRN